jgi:hypothetical protein
MPVRIAGSDKWIKPTTEWKEMKADLEMKNNFSIDKNFYITVKKVQ